MYFNTPKIILYSVFFLLTFSEIRTCKKLLQNSYLFYNLAKTQLGAYNEIAGSDVLDSNNIKESFVEILYTEDKGLMLFNKIRMPDQDNFVSKIIKINPENIDIMRDEEGECSMIINNHVEILNRNFMTYFWLAEVSRYYTTSVNKVNRDVDSTSPFLNDTHELISISIEQRQDGFINMKYGIILERKQNYEYGLYLEKKEINSVESLWDNIIGEPVSSTTSTSTTSTTTTTPSSSSSEPQTTTSSATTITNGNNGNSNGRGNGTRRHRHYYETTWFIVLISFIIIVVIVTIMASVYWLYSRNMMKDTYDMVYNSNERF